MNARTIAGAAVIVASLAVSGRGLLVVDRELRAGHATSVAARVVGDIPEISGFPPGNAEAIQEVRRIVPPDATIRIVTVGGSCGIVPIRHGGAQLLWLTYHLLPRTITCDPDASWQVYFGIAPTDLPPGARVTNVGATISVVQQ